MYPSCDIVRRERLECPRNPPILHGPPRVFDSERGDLTWECRSSGPADGWWHSSCTPLVADHFIGKQHRELRYRDEKRRMDNNYLDRDHPAKRS